MAILIDPPSWPAHGTLWSHLVSDADYEELHPFAARLGLARRSFDLDHYDVPASLHRRAVELGARPVAARDVVHGLRDSGLRVRQVERDAVRPVRRRQYLAAEWASLGRRSSLDGTPEAEAAWLRLGDELLARWNEAHRHYHGERHLEDVLLSLNQLEVGGERIAAATLLAAWFHDAVYTGAAGDDERESAELAVSSLGAIGLDSALAQQVGGLILATTPALPQNGMSDPLAHLLDADLAIFASSEARYAQYTVDVRAEYAHVPEQDFRVARARILDAYLSRAAIYHAEASRRIWEDRARRNVGRELEGLRGGRGVSRGRPPGSAELD